MKKCFFIVLATVFLSVMVSVGMAADEAKDKEDAQLKQKNEALFMKMDTDKDGKVSKLEYVTFYTTNAENKFKKLDKDGDTYLIKEEITVTKVPKNTSDAAKPATSKKPATK
jgi:uncharacterized protein YxeA